jgi:hypothetical protein
MLTTYFLLYIKLPKDINSHLPWRWQIQYLSTHWKTENIQYDSSLKVKVTHSFLSYIMLFRYLNFTILQKICHPHYMQCYSLCSKIIIKDSKDSILLYYITGQGNIMHLFLHSVIECLALVFAWDINNSIQYTIANLHTIINLCMILFKIHFMKWSSFPWNRWNVTELHIPHRDVTQVSS